MTQRICMVLIVAAASLWQSSAQEAWAQEGADSASTTTEFKGKLPTTPWYDGQQEHLIPVQVTPRADDSINRASRWLPKPKSVSVKKDSTTKTTPLNPNNTGVFGSGFTLGNLFGWVLLISIVLMIVGVVVYAIGRAETKLSGNEKEDGKLDGKLPDQQTLERIKHLPPELRRTDVNLRSECERLMNQGEYDQAIILLLGHQLLLLDKYGLLRLARGKTNGKYVRETRSNHADCAQWLRQTADAFEHSYFGRHEIQDDVFVQLWNQNASLEQAALAHGDHS
ncbi:hypothetical protein LOC67_24885 [Stieleria sp. JC731]|uniref:hypothetical protein n=1 Tax=Pirellulaceae TaxID=2691357 RepID=UPI001E608314|nr:hypothetical protein [Stieleria sp. JC731]MCC9603800.1 hypothetical protein [Stieleria sp. JC731]